MAVVFAAAGNTTGGLVNSKPLLDDGADVGGNVANTTDGYDVDIMEILL